MIFGLGKKKLKVTTEQLGEGLWIFCRQFTKMFYEQFKTGLEENDEIYKYAIDILKDRLNRYSKTWDNNSGGNQSILSLEMLECMLNDGKTDKRLLDSYLLSLVNIYVLTMMKEVLHFYKNYEVIDS